MILNWAQIGLGLSSLGVVFFTIASTYIQSKETKIVSEEIIKLTKINNDFSEEAIKLAKENRELNEQIEINTKDTSVKVENLLKPDIRFEKGEMKDNKYYVFFKNYGNSTVEDIEIKWEYSYAPTLFTKQKELTQNTTTSFSVDIFPLNHIPDLKKQYEGQIQDLRNKQISFIVNISISYKYNGENHDFPHAYTLIFDGEKFEIY